MRKNVIKGQLSLTDYTFPEVVIRLKEDRQYYCNKTVSANSAAEMYKSVIHEMTKDLDREHVFAYNLDNHGHILNYTTVSIGTQTCSAVDPIAIFKAAILSNATSVILAHNHPSGDPDPSAEDDEFTKRMISAGAIIGIPLLDHIVAGDNTYYSYREENYDLFDDYAEVAEKMIRYKKSRKK